MKPEIDSPEEIAAVREFFASLSASEQIRLFQFFTTQVLEPTPQAGLERQNRRREAECSGPGDDREDRLVVNGAGDP